MRSSALSVAGSVGVAALSEANSSVTLIVASSSSAQCSVETRKSVTAAFISSSDSSPPSMSMM
jgi:hypothetical protein|tara:strand:+ start:438 stop:626 length:189 start_codon:yes stop_codon:yes gene_type:complete